jgi:Mg-chelatase subunit ChlD
VLDRSAFDSLLEDDPDEAVSLLVGMQAATDEGLRELARRLAASVVVDLARTTISDARGVGRLRRTTADRAEGDVDLDASLEAVADARRRGRPVQRDELVVTRWHRPSLALCLLVDRSGSMHGERLGAAAVAAAAVLLRAGADCSVVAFAGEAVVLASQGRPRDAGEVVADLCRLRGSGVTDVGLALRVAREQLARSTSGRRVAVLLSDCRSTSGGDPAPHASDLDELVIVAPADDTADAEAFAASLGLRWAAMTGPVDAARAISEVLG